ncbi:hypothetical protein C5167_016104 [Papaver somniferum]|nr:hypothetical protein C5167_016104 [Papaver somniferum]
MLHYRIGVVSWELRFILQLGKLDVKQPCCSCCSCGDDCVRWNWKKCWLMFEAETELEQIGSGVAVHS